MCKKTISLLLALALCMGLAAPAYAVSYDSDSVAYSAGKYTYTGYSNKKYKYPTNSSGKTYGSQLMAELAGGAPDLIAAVGTKGGAGLCKQPGSEPRATR